MIPLIDLFSLIPVSFPELVLMCPYRSVNKSEATLSALLLSVDFTVSLRGWLNPSSDPFQLQVFLDL